MELVVQKFVVFMEILCAYLGAALVNIEWSDLAYSFLSLFLEGAPYILLGTLISGFMDVYMPASILERVLPKQKLLAIMSCGLMGLVLPVCECAVVPVIRRLVAKGLPVSCAFTYMLAAPILNPVTIWSTWNAFDNYGFTWDIVLARCAMGYGISVFVGIIILFLPVEKVLRKSVLRTIRSHDDDKLNNSETAHNHAHDHEHGHQQGDLDDCGHQHAKEECCSHDHEHSHEVVIKSNDGRVVAAMRSAMRDCVDVGVYFTIGAALAAMFNMLYVQYQSEFELALSSPVAEIGGMMLLAFVLSVCSTSDAFMAAAIDFVSYGAKMAFMVLGPMLDVKLLFLYQTVMTKKFLLWFSIGLFVVVGLVTWSWDGMFSEKIKNSNTNAVSQEVVR